MRIFLDAGFTMTAQYQQNYQSIYLNQAARPKEITRMQYTSSVYQNYSNC